MTEKETKSVETKVEQINVDLDDIFNAAPGGDSITLPEETSKKPGLFTRKKEVDTSFLYEAKKEETAVEDKKEETVENEKNVEAEVTEEVK